ncbi:MAG TPA: hypothetical protein VM493_05395 [Vicinamibacterales bacterium]|nr:hypothetical protein [Vicinamibacterales bacterium]
MITIRSTRHLPWLRLRSRLLLCAVALVAGTAAPSTQSPDSLPIDGQIVGGVSRAWATTDEIMHRRSEITAAVSSAIVPRSLLVPRPGNAGDPRPVRSEAAVSSGAGSEVISSALTVSTTFNAASLFETNALPPDGSGAAGPAQFILAANGRIRSFAKATGAPDGVLNVSSDSFFASVRGGAETFGARIRYDRLAGRWFITMATTALPGRVLIAVSNMSVVSSGTIWSFFAFDNTFPGGCAIDSPTLGIDVQALYIGVSQFCSGGTAYAGSSAFVVSKVSLTNGGDPFVTAFHNLTGTPAGNGLFAPHGVDNDSPIPGAGYFIAADNGALGRLILRRVQDPGGTPTLSADIGITVASTAAPIRVPHLGNLNGTNGTIDGGDDRLTSAHLVNGRLWTAHTIGVTDSGVASASATRNGVRWYELQGLDGTPTVVQSGTIHSSSGGASVNERSYWVPSIATTPRGRTVVGFSTAGSQEAINAGATERLAGDAAGSMSTPSLLSASSSTYNPASDPGSAIRGRRWGSYSATSVDPCDNSTVWTLQQYADAADSYGLLAARLTGPPPAQPVSVSPSVVPGGVTSIDVQVTAASSAGSAFFDPGPGFGCRLSAAVQGATVNSVTFTGPTSLTMNISTINATPGARVVTVINPDGQTSSSGGILTVLPGPVVTLDSPKPGVAGQPLNVQGWAVDGGAPTGTGVQMVHVYAIPDGGAGMFLGQATYGIGRDDVAAMYGSRFSGSGFQLTAPMLPAGNYTIVAYALRTTSGAFDSAAAVAITAGGVAAPFGTVDTPSNDLIVAGEVAVTGWALDDAAVAKVEIMRSPVAGEGPGLVFVGNASFVRGARPDVQAAYPSLPNSDAAGWGYMLLSNMLPNRGSVTVTLSVYAVDHAGLRTLLGTRRIIAANAASLAPFGTIDTPGQGQTVSGVIANFGWALTPAHTSIPIDGSTIDVYVDNIFMGHPTYGLYRADIATLFPGLANSNGAVGLFSIDTTLLTNGLHTISWVVRDNAGRSSGIGSRYFRVQNGS